MAAASAPIDLTPYPVDASSLEPRWVTYRVVIQIDAEPESYKVMELTCGEQLRYEEHYLPAGRLARDLHINEAQLPLEQVLGRDAGWYLGHSTVTYHRESVAIEQALGMWNASGIVEAFQQGKVVRARYGIKEVETGYVEWLGACARPDQAWEKRATREEYLADRAEELTIAHALNVDRLRARLPVKTTEFDDEWVLSALHYRRAKSNAIPEAARRESERWLREHPDAGERSWRHR